MHWVDRHLIVEMCVCVCARMHLNVSEFHEVPDTADFMKRGPFDSATSLKSAKDGVSIYESVILKLP